MSHTIPDSTTLFFFALKKALHCELCSVLRRRPVTMMCPKPNKTRAKYMLFGRSIQENCARWNLKIFIGRWPLFQLTFCFLDDSHFSLTRTANYLEGIFWELFIIHLLADEFIAFILTDESHKQRHNLIFLLLVFGLVLMDITLRWIHHQSWCEREQAHCCKVIELPIGRLPIISHSFARARS